jgi:hypothetical protein
MECKTPWRPGGKRHLTEHAKGCKTATLQRTSMQSGIPEGTNGDQSAQPGNLDIQPKRVNNLNNSTINISTISHVPHHLPRCLPIHLAPVSIVVVGTKFELPLPGSLSKIPTPCQILPEPMTQHPVINRYAGVPPWTWWWGSSPKTTNRPTLPIHGSLPARPTISQRTRPRKTMQGRTPF